MELTLVGTEVRGIRTPIINPGDDLVSIIVEYLSNASKEGKFKVENNDILCVTESIVAICQNNVVSLDKVGRDMRSKFKSSHLGITFPVMSRNRFQNILSAATKAFDKVSVLLRNPSDEMGNGLVKGNPYKADTNFYTVDAFYKKYGRPSHSFTGVNYIELYESTGADVYISSDPADILKLTDQVMVSTVHDREQHKAYLLEKGAKTVLTMADIMTSPIDGSGFNDVYGLLGSNKRGDSELKLFPRDGMPFVQMLQAKLKEKFNADVHVMIFGDGAFKDPLRGIWELNDPVVSPAFTPGLSGTLKAGIKLKNEVVGLPPHEQDLYLKNLIAGRTDVAIDDPKSLGVTPRRITDLVGSLADLCTGSGDKGTPVVHIKGYFSDRYNR